MGYLCHNVRLRANHRRGNGETVRANGGGGLQENRVFWTQGCIHTGTHRNSQWLWQHTQDMRKLKSYKVPARNVMR